MRLFEITKEEFKDALSDPFVAAFLSDINDFKDDMSKYLESFDMHYQNFTSFEPVLGKYVIRVVFDGRKFSPGELVAIFNKHMSSQVYDMIADLETNLRPHMYTARYEIYRHEL